MRRVAILAVVVAVAAAGPAWPDRAQDEAGRSKPKGGLRAVLGFNKKRAKAAQEQSAARTAELGRRLEQLKLEAEAAAEAEARAEDEHRHLHDEVQKLTDAHIKKLDALLEAKEKEIMEV